MNLAIKKYQFIPIEDKPEGIPDVWICEVRELGDSIILPEGENWEFMTLETYNQYLIDNKSIYDAWANVYYSTKI